MTAEAGPAPSLGDTQGPGRPSPLLVEQNAQPALALADSSQVLEPLQRSIVMISPGQLALRREEAIVLVEDLAGVEEWLDALRAELRRLADS